MGQVSAKYEIADCYRYL